MLLLSESLQRSSLLLTRLSSAQSRTRGRGRGIQLRAVAGMTGPPAGVAEGAAAAAVAAPTANPTLHHSEVLLATSEPFDGWRFPMCTSQTNMIVRYPMPCPARAAAFASRDSWAAYLRAAGLRLRVHPEDTMAAAAAAPPDAAGNPPAAAATYADLSGVEFAICWNPPSGLLARERCSVLRSALCAQLARETSRLLPIATASVPARLACPRCSPLPRLARPACSAPTSRRCSRWGRAWTA